eukprot:1697533-Rhodomonas_salina.5
MARGRVEEFVRDAIQGGRPLEATEGLVKQADEALERLHPCSLDCFTACALAPWIDSCVDLLLWVW